jgi:hypothetical protein
MSSGSIPTSCHSTVSVSHTSWIAYGSSAAIAFASSIEPQRRR